MKLFNKEYTKEETVKGCDKIMVGLFVAMLIMRFATITYFSMIASETGADIEAIHNVYEASPIAKAIFNIEKVGYMLQVMIIPAMAMAVYYFFRRKTLKGMFDPDMLYFYVNFGLFSMLVNVMNDVAAVAGKVIGG